MSSTEYWAELRPDSRLRRAVIASGFVLLILGLLMLLFVDWSPILRGLIGVSWGGLTALRLLQLARAYTQNGILRLGADGGVNIEATDGRRVAAALQPGSLVLQRYAWLRIAPEVGRPYAELLTGDPRENEDWRRFQVIWRHIGALN